MHEIFQAFDSPLLTFGAVKLISFSELLLKGNTAKQDV